MFLVYHLITNLLSCRILHFSRPWHCPAEDMGGATPEQAGTRGPLCKFGCTHGSMQNEEERLLNVAIPTSRMIIHHLEKANEAQGVSGMH